MKKPFFALVSVALLFLAVSTAKAQDWIGSNKVLNYWDASGLLVGTRYVSTCSGYTDILFGTTGVSMTFADHARCQNPIRMVAPFASNFIPQFCAFGYYTMEDGVITGFDPLPAGECVYTNPH